MNWNNVDDPDILFESVAKVFGKKLAKKMARSAGFIYNAENEDEFESYEDYGDDYEDDAPAAQIC